MQTPALAALAVALASIAPVFAQAPEETAVPPVLVVVREQIKEGREAAHLKSEQAWPRLFEKNNVGIHYIGMTTEFGPPEAWFLEPYDSVAAMQKARAALDRPAISGDLASANSADGELRTASRTLLANFRGDLSYRAADAMAGMPKSRHMGVTILRVKYGHDADLVSAAKMRMNGDQLSNSPQSVLTYQVVSGGPAGMYFIFEPMDSLARLDEAAARTAASRQAMGERNRQHFETLAADLVQSVENYVFDFNPHMSYVSKEFAAHDPGYWNPRLAAPSRPPVRRKRKAS